MSRASLKWNVAANYVGQLYMTAINVLMLPRQIRLLGAEGYGLVGFFAVLSGWLQLLDAGLSATLSRETSSYRAGGLAEATYRALLRSVEALFVLLGGAAALLVFSFSGPISKHWLNPDKLSVATVQQAVALMGLVFAFRWQAGLSRSVLIGLERQVLVNAVTVVSATLRSVGVLVALYVIEPTARVFFIYQAVVAALELVFLRTATSRSLRFPKLPFALPSLQPIRKVAGFSLRVAFAGLVWAMVTQLDKLLLSKFLALRDYAWFSLGVSAAAGISILAAPIGQAVQPRLTYYFAALDDAAFRSTYSEATQVLSAVALTASLVAALAGQQVIWVWTGDPELSQRVAPVFSLYALGNGLLAIGTVTYYLQVARGDLKLQVRGNVAFGVLLVPIIAFATLRGGMIGAGVAWCGANLSFFVVWSAIVHRHFLPGLHWRWILRDALLPGLLGSISVVWMAFMPWTSLSRLQAGALLAVIGLLALGAGSLATRPAWRVLRRLGLTPFVAGRP